MSQFVHAHRPLQAIVGGGGGWYRAKCPQFDVYGGGSSPAEARESLFESVRATAKYVVGLNGSAAQDPRRPYAVLVVDNLANLEQLFE